VKRFCPILLVMLTWCASADPIAETTPAARQAPALLVLHDQYDAPQTLAFPTTNITFLTIADRTGSAQLAGWIAPVKQRFGERIEIRGIADMSTVPRLLRGLVRRKFRELEVYPVMMDWTGDAVKAFTAVPERANVLVLDQRGRIVWRCDGPASGDRLKALYAAIDAALAERN
jgi:hypothetical protein